MTQTINACTNCDTPTLFPTDGTCETCCRCRECQEKITCQECDSVKPEEDMCEFCGSCLNGCCECFVCPGCDSRHENNNNECHECGECEEICCQCWYCYGCATRHRERVDCCSDCERCFDSCECTGDDDDDEDSSNILNYSANPLDYLNFFGKPKDRLFMGVELEVEADNNHEAGEKAGDWKYAARDWLICKHDGSLDHGFEIVTAPSDLPTHAEKWTRLLGNKSLKAGLTSWKTDTCGMHVHLSRNAISPLTLGKLLVFINSEKTRDKVVTIAGRDTFYSGDYSAKKVTSSISRGYWDNKICPNYGNTRYEAINLANRDTIEYRIFKGTLDLTHVLANVEFCHATVKWAEQCSIRDCESWDNFMAWTKKQGKTYKNFVAYMASRESK